MMCHVVMKYDDVLILLNSKKGAVDRQHPFEIVMFY